MQFPEYRPRRLRANESIRAMVRENALSPSDLIYPLFVKPGQGGRDEVTSMPGVFQLTLDQLPAEIDELKSLGILSVILFGLPETKDEAGSGAYAEDGIVQQAIRAIKAHDPTSSSSPTSACASTRATVTAARSMRLAASSTT